MMQHAFNCKPFLLQHISCNSFLHIYVSTNTRPPPCFWVGLGASWTAEPSLRRTGGRWVICSEFCGGISLCHSWSFINWYTNKITLKDVFLLEVSWTSQNPSNTRIVDWTCSELSRFFPQLQMTRGMKKVQLREPWLCHLLSSFQLSLPTKPWQAAAGKTSAQIAEMRSRISQFAALHPAWDGSN